MSSIYLYYKDPKYINHIGSQIKVWKSASNSVHRTNHHKMGDTSPNNINQNLLDLPIKNSFHNQCQINISIQNSDLCLLGNSNFILEVSQY